jgi:molecular chaperone GrpE
LANSLNVLEKLKDMNASEQNNHHHEESPESLDIAGNETLGNPESDEHTTSDTTIDPIVKLQAELTEVQDKYLRMYSEFENFKRRTTKERTDLLRSANQETLVSLLPVLDDFDRAQKSIQSTEGNEAIKTGVDLVYNKLKNILQQKGLKEMDTDEKVFDSEFHEAITKIPTPNESLKGKVVDTLEKGYFLNEKVIRFAKVVVGE